MLYRFRFSKGELRRTYPGIILYIPSRDGHSNICYITNAELVKQTWGYPEGLNWIKNSMYIYSDERKSDFEIK